MQNLHTREFPEANIESILEWLALAHGQTGLEGATGLQRQILTLRATSLPAAQRHKLLDLLYNSAAKLIAAQLPLLHEATLPVSRKIRKMVRISQDILEMLAQDYLSTLTEASDLAGEYRSAAPQGTLRRAMRCISWRLTISYLSASPLGAGIWQQLHSTFQASRRQGVESVAGPNDEQSAERIYLASLLLSVVQPASFNSRELDFIEKYIDSHIQVVELSDDPPSVPEGIFWVDMDRDAPPHALTRRVPPPDTGVLYFACDRIARGATDHLFALKSGRSAAELGLPAFAETHAGRGVLKRLGAFWGQPAKRKFPRRRQSYRADLCTGLEQLWQLLRDPAQPPTISEWMITNESPDGYATMHVSGTTEQLRVGDIVALRPRRGDAIPDVWQICIVRWALSENPQHIELGLQVLAGHGIPATLARRQGEAAVYIPAILLPEAPPMRPTRALALPTGTVHDQLQKLVVVAEQRNVAVLELRATQLQEQTSTIEVFTVEPDETP